MAKRTPRKLKISPKVRAQPLPLRNPHPTRSQRKAMNMTIPAKTSIMPASIPPTPKRPMLARSAEPVISKAPNVRPMTAVAMASIAMMVTPIGRGGFVDCMSRGLPSTNS